MLETRRSFSGLVSAPHHLAAESGAAVLREGGNAIEAMISAAATIAAVYPHMNGLGGDCFFVITAPGREPVVIEASGRAGEQATTGWYADRGFGEVPGRGPEAALTVAGAVSGWEAAFELSKRRFGGRLPLPELLADAMARAREGIPVSRSLHDNIVQKQGELDKVPGFARTYLEEGAPLSVGARLVQSRMADTLEYLGKAGLADFYRGDVARTLAADLVEVGAPLALADLEAHQAMVNQPLSTLVRGHRVFNVRPPTQGLASLILLALYDRLGVSDADGFDFVHGLVEATKSAFEIRDRHVTDPDYMSQPAEVFLAPDALDRLAAGIDRKSASEWPRTARPGDTVWLGAADAEGTCVSFIQSLYWEFGSGVVLPQTGVTWQNRGASFSLDKGHLNALRPRRRPFHTIQPPVAHMTDDSVMSYGTMGGEGQPQTQAVIFARHVLHGQDLQTAVTAPRWLLGRTWGASSTSLKMESRFEDALVEALRRAGHEIEIVGPFDPIMGHAGAVRRYPDGLIEGAADPRSDGCVATV